MKVVSVSPFEALAEARHRDPFGVLGPHVEGDHVVIRAIFPAADEIGRASCRERVYVLV